MRSRKRKHKRGGTRSEMPDRFHEWANHLKMVEPDQCGKLSPLAVSLSNVYIMLMCENRHQKILLIGEYHDIDKGTIPAITDVITSFLRDTKYVDFMFECNQVEYRPFKWYNPKRVILSNLCRMLKSQLPTRKGDQLHEFSRVHWLDQSYKEKHKREKRDNPIWITQLDALADAYTINAKIEDEYAESHFPELIDAFQNTFKTAHEFIEHVLDQILNLKDFQQCGLHSSLLTRENYSRILLKLYTRNKTFCKFAFEVHRFIMDMYTCCRVLRMEGEWYRNIVVYTGGFHSARVGWMLSQADFTVRRVNVTMDETLPLEFTKLDDLSD